MKMTMLMTNQKKSILGKSEFYFFALMLFCFAFTQCSTTTKTTTSSTGRRPVITRPAMPTDNGMNQPNTPAQTSETSSSTGESSVFSGNNTEPLSPAKPIVVAQANPAAESLVNKAIDQIKSNDLTSAEWNLEEAIRLAPNYGPAYYWMAKLKYQEGSYNEAHSFINKAESLAPQDPTWQQRIQILKNRIQSGA